MSLEMPSTKEKTLDQTRFFDRDYEGDEIISFVLAHKLAE
jgi:hypothetical protein